jgi:hypothetical protein
VSVGGGSSVVNRYVEPDNPPNTLFDRSAKIPDAEVTVYCIAGWKSEPGFIVTELPAIVPPPPPADGLVHMLLHESGQSKIHLIVPVPAPYPLAFNFSAFVGETYIYSDEKDERPVTVFVEPSNHVIVWVAVQPSVQLLIVIPSCVNVASPQFTFGPL